VAGGRRVCEISRVSLLIMRMVFVEVGWLAPPECGLALGCPALTHWGTIIDSSVNVPPSLKRLISLRTWID
jgi:hypothetical protein